MRVSVAASKRRFAYTDQLVDQDLVVIASTTGGAAAAMTGLGWFAGDGEDASWVNWAEVPDDSADKADAIRAWLQQNPVADVDDGSSF